MPTLFHTDSPPPFAFNYDFEVASSDIDALGHVGNVDWVRFVNDATQAHSLSIGMDLAAYRRMGVLWVVRRHDVLYLGPAFSGDKLRAATWVHSARAASSLRKTQFYRQSDGALLVRAETTWALVSIETGKPLRIPEELMKRYGVTKNAPPGE